MIRPENTQPTPDIISQVKAEQGVRDLLLYLGENPDRDGLKDTPARVVKAMLEMTRGNLDDPGEILTRRFDQGDGEFTPYRDLILLRDIEFVSLCEHHCLPFDGRAHIGYIPGADGRIVGISKLARLLECFARRLQVQERLTSQIADALSIHLAPLGVIVVVQAGHSCMKCRGIRKQNSSLITSSLRGIFESDQAARAEALQLIHSAR